MTEQVTHLNTAIVEKFLYALRDKDFDTMESMMADDAVYENYGYSRTRGSHRIANLLRGMERPSVGFDVKFHRNVAEGDNVLNERTDLIRVGRVRVLVGVCGVFEVRDGQIVLWRDYFDIFDAVKGVVRALAGVAVPSLNRSF